MDYGSLTHHSNMDSYEHIRPEDLKQAATIMADFVYNAAMCDEMIPRKPIRPDDPPAEGGFGQRRGEIRAAQPVTSTVENEGSDETSERERGRRGEQQLLEMLQVLLRSQNV